MPSRWIRLIGIASAVLVMGAWAAWPSLRTAAFLLDIAGVTGRARSVLPVRTQGFTTTDVLVPTRYGGVAARLYSAARSDHGVVVFPGIHGGGPDEPRLALFCGRLAATGLTVLCVPLPELRQFLITAHSTDAIEDVTVWAAKQPSLAPKGRLGLVGVSFAGGLAIVAAGRPSLAEHVEAIVSIGGYGDLPRVLRFLCTGVMPDGSTRIPHEYGLAVIALGAVPHLVPPEQAGGLETGIRLYLQASLDDSPGKPQATALLGAARKLRDELAEPSRSLLTAVLDRDRPSLGHALEPFIDVLSSDPALSPERSPRPAAPVFLLHGRDDNVIPSSETPLLADYLGRGHVPVRALLTPLLTHAHLQSGVTIRDAWALVHFWNLLRAALD